MISDFVVEPVSPARVARRTLLKSAGGLIAAGAVTRLAQAQPDRALPATAPLRRRQVGFVLSHEQFTVNQLLDFGVAAEQAGFGLISTSDHFQPWQPNEGHSGMAWITLSALGQRTKQIAMGTAVTCPSFRYEPAVVAQAFASLATLYPGRMYLGIGSGEALNEVAAAGKWAGWAERSDRMVEATALIRELWKGEPVNEHGKYYELNGRLYDPPQSPPTILMAANGPKAMRRAGQYGDGLITDPKTWKQHRTEFEQGARAAGREPAHMPVVIEHFVVVGGKQDAEAAAEVWRFLPKAFKPYYEIPEPGAIQARARAELPLEGVYRDWPVSVEADAHVDAIAKLFDAGATAVLVHSGQADQRRVIDFYGARVLPRLQM